MDDSVLHAINGFFFHHDAIEDPFLAYSNASQAIFLVLVLGLVLLANGRHATAIRRAGVAAGLSAALALLVTQVISQLVDRARPFVADPSGVHLFGHHAADPGFPSDHATAAFAIAMAIALRSPRWGAPLLAAATLLCIARVGLGVHYPSDVVAGALVGSLCALGLWMPRIVARVDALADLIGRVLGRALAAVRLRPAA